MGAPFTTTRGYVRERVLEELYRRPGEYLSTQQLTALIDEADTSAEIASICFDLKRTQRLCTGQKVMGANGIPANTWGLSAGERADLERRRPDLAALAAPKGKGQASGAKAKVKGNGRGHDPALAKGAKGKAAKGAEAEVAGVKQGLTTAGSATPADPATPATPPTPAPAVVLAAADLDALGLPAAAPGDDPLPLPTESHEDERPLPVPAKTGCGGHGTCGGHCANHERDSQADELDQARQELEFTRSALNEARFQLEQQDAWGLAKVEECNILRKQLDDQCARLAYLEHGGGAQAICLADDLDRAQKGLKTSLEAMDVIRRDLLNAKQDRGELQARLDDRDAVIARQSQRLQELRTEAEELIAARNAMHRDLKDALQDNAALESFRDSFMDILRERDSRLAWAQRRIDALILAVRPHLGAPRDPEPGQPAGPEEAR